MPHFSPVSPVSRQQALTKKSEIGFTKHSDSFCAGSQTATPYPIPVESLVDSLLKKNPVERGREYIHL